VLIFAVDGERFYPSAKTESTCVGLGLLLGGELCLARLQGGTTGDKGQRAGGRGQEGTGEDRREQGRGGACGAWDPGISRSLCVPVSLYVIYKLHIISGRHANIPACKHASAHLLSMGVLCTIACMYIF
jgi:hypothetical protein